MATCLAVTTAFASVASHYELLLWLDNSSLRSRDLRGLGALNSLHGLRHVLVLLRRHAVVHRLLGELRVKRALTRNLVGHVTLHGPLAGARLVLDLLALHRLCRRRTHEQHEAERCRTHNRQAPAGTLRILLLSARLHRHGGGDALTGNRAAGKRLHEGREAEQARGQDQAHASGAVAALRHLCKASLHTDSPECSQLPQHWA
mmetsp:Transcript_63911/g.164509  ORF Transcript_63911/g.164509 Transcript_63911/m.164509 type:complete len:203 (-) Transcript_63911:2-610(-)